MDPLSTIANVITLFEFSIKIQNLVSRWKDSPKYLRDVEQSVRDMRTVLTLVTDKSEVASAALSDEKYIETIGNFAMTCSRLAKELYDILYGLNASTSSFDRIRHMFKERDINEKTRQIQDYAQKLTLLLSSLNSKKSTRIEAALAEINKKLDDLALPAYPGPSDHVVVTSMEEASSSTDLFDFLLEGTPPGESERNRRPSFFDGIQDMELDKKKEMVEELEAKKMFFKAAQIQQNIIDVVRSQVDMQPEGDMYDVCDLQEHHADLLLACSTHARHNEAAAILSDALQRLKERSPDHASLAQQGRLMSKLAKLYRGVDGLGEKHNPAKSKSFFTNSIIYLSRAGQFLPEDFLTVGVAMVEFHEANSQPGLAKELKTRILDTMKQRSPDLKFEWNTYQRSRKESVLDWCQKEGFCSKELRFRFDVVQPSKHSDTSPLHLAVQKGQRERVEEMLVEVNDVDFPDIVGLTPLLLAASKRQSEIVQVLLNYGASTEIRTSDDRTALHLCMDEDARGGVRVTKCLLEEDTKLIDQRDSKGRTALHLAVMKGHLKITSLLLDQQTSPSIVNITEENGKTALLVAVESNFQKHSRSQTSPSSPLRRMATSGTAVSTATSNTTSSTNTSTTPSSRRSSQSQTTRPGPRPNSKANIIELLLEKSADPTIADHTDNLPLHSACKQNDIETVRLLLQARARFDRDLVNQAGPMRATPMIAAVREGHVAVVRELVGWGANPNLADVTGRSARDYARQPGARKHELLQALQGL